MRYFKVIHNDSVTMLRSFGEVRDEKDNLVGYDHVAVMRYPDEIVSEEQLSPVVIKALDEGDAHTTAMIVECDEHGQVGVDHQPRRVGRPPKSAVAPEAE